MKRTKGPKCKCGCGEFVSRKGVDPSDKAKPRYLQGHQPEPEMKMIQRIAWSFHNTTGLDWEELASEAKCAYYRALNDYEPDKAQSLTSWVWSRMRFALITYAKKEQKSFERFPEEYEPEIENTEREIIFNNLLAGLSADAQFIYNLVIENPHKYLASDRARSEIKEELRNQGWKWKQIWASFKEIKGALQSIAI